MSHRDSICRSGCEEASMVTAIHQFTSHHAYYFALLARVKGERNERCRLPPLALVKHSGRQVGEWLCRTMNGFTSKGVMRGPIFRLERQGKASRGSVTDSRLLEGKSRALARGA
jgi:hypothetical protein